MRSHDVDETMRDLQALLGHPREEMSTEYKQWMELRSEELAQAKLAKAAIALANFGGGHIVFGFREVEKFLELDPARPDDLSGYGQDIVNAQVKKYAEPPFECAVHLVEHPEGHGRFPIVAVPPGRVPIRSRRNGPGGKEIQEHVYYTRAPLPESVPISTGPQWAELLRRCSLADREALVDEMRRLVLGVGTTMTPEEAAKKELDEWITVSRSRFEELVKAKLPDETPSRYSRGFWTAAYSLIGGLQEHDLSDFRDILRKAVGRETGWPAWRIPGRPELEPYPCDGVIECWMADSSSCDAAHSDFWRASPKGKMFLLRGYDEDGEETPHPGTTLIHTLPIWRVGECLLHAERLARIVGDDETRVYFRYEWEGLRGRSLVADSRRAYIREGRTVKQQNTVGAEILVKASEIGTRLPEITAEITKPLYQLFDFFKVPPEVFQKELARMRGLL